MSVSLDAAREGARRRGGRPIATARKRPRARPTAARRSLSPLPPPPPQFEVLYLSDGELRDLRRGLARALEEVGLGTGATRIVARMSRLARNEIARRERRAPSHRPPTATQH